MKVSVIISDNMIKNLQEYTHSATINEAVNIALKDWLIIYKMKELNKKLSKKTIYGNGNNIQHIRDTSRL
jgi:hypothetical protein